MRFLTFGETQPKKKDFSKFPNMEKTMRKIMLYFLRYYDIRTSRVKSGSPAEFKFYKNGDKPMKFN